MNVWGCVDRQTGLICFCPFQKLTKTGSHRFGPAKAAEVLPLVAKCVKKGSIVFSDGLRAYKSKLKRMGYQHSSVNHQSGEYARQSSQYDGVVVHTNSIEGGAATRTGCVV